MRNIWLVLLLLASGAAQAASFDCSKAKTPQEKAICASPELSKADEEMAAAYKDVLAAVPQEIAVEVREDQRQWLRWIAVECPASENTGESERRETLAECLLRNYRSRTEELQHMILREGGVTFISRSINLTWPDAPGESPGSEEVHGYGTMKATWPQSINDTAEWKAWNKAVEAAAQNLAAIPDGESSPSGKWLEKWAADGDFEVSATIGLVSQELVTASIGLEGMGHGAAHPNEAGIEFNWLLKEKREIRPEDVFRKDSDWEKTIEARCAKELQQPDAGLYDNWEKALPKVVLDSRNWELKGEGLTIDFPEYTVAPRVSPVGPVTIPWEDLKPLLQPGFAIPK
jgi:uncharacterized protein YecT (DUF1311 family)